MQNDQQGQPKKTGSDFGKQRRKLLKLLGLGSAALAGEKALGQIRVEKVINPVMKDIQAVKGTGNSYTSVQLLRPFDMLALELRFYNFSFVPKGAGGPVMMRGSGAAYMAVIFQPQSIGEECGTEDTAGLHLPADNPLKAMLAEKSRLVFEIPAAISSIKLTLDELLGWEKYNLKLNPRAKGVPQYFQYIPVEIKSNPKLYNFQKKIEARTVGKPNFQQKSLSKDEKIILMNSQLQTTGRGNAFQRISDGVIGLINEKMGMPDELETALEVPLRLFLSPTPGAAFAHIKKLNADKGLLKDTNKLFELWHTRLANKTKDGIDDSDLTTEARILRAIWAVDANPDAPRLPSTDAQQDGKDVDKYLGLTSITAKDRHKIVHESSNFQIPNFIPQPVRAKQLFLTALGAWLDSEMLVERKKLNDAGLLGTLNLLKWRHIETMAREHYVEVVTAGNILPFGHEAVLVKITERKPHKPTGAAVNFQRTIVVITETVKDYNYRDAGGTFLKFPFSKVEMVTTVTPLLDPDKQKFAPISKTGEQQFIIKVGGNPVKFKIKAEDLDGNHCHFELPLVYVATDAFSDENSGAFQESNLDAILKAYNDAISAINSSTNLNGQKITLAPPHANGANTAFETREIDFGVQKYLNNANEPQRFLPQLNEAKIIEPSYQRLTGIATPVPVEMVSDNNPGAVYAKFNFSQPIMFSGQSDKTGGFAAPNFNLSGLSKVAGPFGGDFNNFQSGVPSPASYFNVNSMPDPMLFGAFKLSDIVKFADTIQNLDIEKEIKDRVPSIPNLTNKETADSYITSYRFEPDVSNKELAFVSLNFTALPGKEKNFSINTQVITPKKGTGKPQFSTDAHLKAFSVDIFKKPGWSHGLMYIYFNELSFNVNSSAKVDIVVDIQKPGITFGGPLTFINAFRDLIPADGFSDPPYLDVSLAGVKAGYTQALPNLQLGVFTLSHLSLSADLNLPFTGAPMTVGFRFCERQQPFTLTVSCLGGGGFFGIEADFQGIRSIEAALEFGAAVSLNLGVASGAVSIMAGIYFKMIFESGNNSTQLTGYVRINGAMSIIGLITASLEFYMALTYLSEGGKNKAYGEASLKIKVEVLFFSTSVTVHTSRTFAGSGADPNFGTMIKPDHWKKYCGAFAAA